MLIVFLDINLPLSSISFVLVLFFLRVRTPEGSILSKAKRVDWLYVYHLVHSQLLLKGCTVAETLL